MAVSFARLAVNGVHLHVALAGPVDGPLLILLHGFPESWLAWERHIPVFAAAGFRVMAPDQRGYNLSDKPKHPRSYVSDELVGDIVGLIEGAGRTRATIVGHDWGAAVAWWLALRHPERVEKLVVMDVPHPSVMRRHLLSDPRQMLRSWYMGFFQLPAVPEALLARADHKLLEKIIVATALPDSFPPARVAAYKRTWNEPGALTGMLNWYRAGRIEVFRTTAKDGKKAEPPTLILWGQQDVALRPEMAHESAKHCEVAQLEVFPDLTHWLHHEAPQRVQERILRFLAPADPGVSAV